MAVLLADILEFAIAESGAAIADEAIQLVLAGLFFGQLFQRIEGTAVLIEGIELGGHVGTGGEPLLELADGIVGLELELRVATHDLHEGGHVPAGHPVVIVLSDVLRRDPVIRFAGVGRVRDRARGQAALFRQEGRNLALGELLLGEEPIDAVGGVGATIDGIGLANPGGEGVEIELGSLRAGDDDGRNIDDRV